MAQNIEDFLPPIQSAGLNTLKNTSLGGTLAVTGASTFTGVATFSAAPIFSAGRLLNMVNESTNATLTVAQSGSTVVFTSSTGTLITLPAPTVGTTYDFVIASSVTSGTHAVVTNNTAATFIYGGVQMGEASGANNLNALANGSSNVAIRMNGSTLGGLIGTAFRMTCTSATQWAITGLVAGSGTLATPFTTS